MTPTNNIMLGFMRHQNNKFYDQKFIDYAISNEITYFETCEFYMNNQCEAYVYSLLNKYPREKYKIHGKLSKNTILINNWENIFNQQIKNIPGHYFDSYVFQALDEICLYPLLNTNILSFFQKQKEYGLIKEFGLSIQCGSDITKILLSLYDWDIIQMPLNFFDWYLCDGENNYNLAIKKNIPIIAQAPLKGGLLKDCVQEAYNFVTSLKGINSILCGNTRIETLELTKNYIENPIQTNFNYIEYIKNYQKNNFINCIGCNKCSQICPNRIPIYTFIQMYNRALVNSTSFKDYCLLKTSIGEPINLCSDCGKCKNICPLGKDFVKIFHDKIFELRV